MIQNHTKFQQTKQSQPISFPEIHQLLASGQLKGKCLKGSEILDAKILLYKVYVEECRWDIPKDNISGI